MPILAHVEWALGDREGAYARSEAAIRRMADIRGDANSLAIALTWDMLMAACERDGDHLHAAATRMIALARETGGMFWEQWGHCGLGTAEVIAGNAAGGLAPIATGVEGLFATGGLAAHSLPDDLPCRGAHRVGDLTRALEVLAESQALIERTEQRFYEPETHRRRGTVMEAAGRRGEAEAAYRRAVEIADRQGSVTWRDRAAANLVAIGAAD